MRMEILVVWEILAYISGEGQYDPLGCLCWSTDLGISMDTILKLVEQTNNQIFKKDVFHHCFVIWYEKLTIW